MVQSIDRPTYTFAYYCSGESSGGGPRHGWPSEKEKADGPPSPAPRQDTASEAAPLTSTCTLRYPSDAPCWLPLTIHSGHATRVVALTHELLTRSHRVHICTNAPEYVFNTAIASGAQYRHAEIDAGIVQPKAYDVARRQTVDGLRAFLAKREARLQQEAEWLKSIKADAVLVDAPFLPW